METRAMITGLAEARAGLRYHGAPGDVDLVASHQVTRDRLWPFALLLLLFENI